MSRYRSMPSSFLVASALLLCCCFVPAAARQIEDTNANVRRARAFADHLASGRVAEAAEMFDERMSKAMSPDQLQMLWQNLEQQAGAFKSFGTTRAERKDQHEIVFLYVDFEKHALRLKIVFDAAGRIGGLWVEPAESPSPEARRAAAYSPPSYDRPDRYVAEKVTFGAEPWEVSGILTLPRGDGRLPAVVLVHGSGPHDEDETVGPNKPFRDLAAGLSSNGVAVLRYKKRTHAYALRLAADGGRISVREEIVDDALAALSYLRGHPRVDRDRIYVVGHSLGATLAPQIATEDGKVAGAVLLAGTPRDLTDVLLDQLGYIASLPMPNQAENQKLYDEALSTILKVRNGELGDDATVLNVPVAYWNELTDAAERSLELLKGLSCRLLIVNGGRDYQVTRKDYDLYQQAPKGRSKATFKWFEKCNHLFIAGEGMGTPQEYGAAGNVDEKVIKYLVKWIKTEE